LSLAGARGAPFKPSFGLSGVVENRPRQGLPYISARQSVITNSSAVPYFLGGAGVSSALTLAGLDPGSLFTGVESAPYGRFISRASRDPVEVWRRTSDFLIKLIKTPFIDGACLLALKVRPVSSGPISGCRLNRSKHGHAAASIYTQLAHPIAVTWPHPPRCSPRAASRPCCQSPAVGER
jgi:hypothetical protein